LVEVAGSGGVTKRMPALRVSVSKTAQEACQFPVQFGPQNEMPMVGHHAVAKDPGSVAFQGVIDYPLESRKVFSSIE
jgi:hypothetical protein